jgi:hypothetical protein
VISHHFNRIAVISTTHFAAVERQPLRWREDLDRRPERWPRCAVIVVCGCTQAAAARAVGVYALR